MKTWLANVAVVASLSLLWTSAEAADQTSPGADGGPSRAAVVDLGTSPISKMSSKYNTDNFTCTTSVQNLITKQINNTKAGDVTVLFQSENFPGCRILLGLQRNGVDVPGPGDGASPFASHDTDSELSTNGFNFVVNNVPAGNQTFSVTCQCDSGTTLVDERSIIILHR